MLLVALGGVVSKQAVHHWYDVSWVDWLSVGGTLLSLVGLWLTFRQAKKATRVSQAVQTTVAETQEQLRATNVLLQIAHLHGLTASLDAAINENNSGVVRHVLDNWRFAAGRVHSILLADPNHDPEMLSKVQVSLGLCYSASTTLLTGGTPILKACGRARRAMGEAYDALELWVGQQAYVVPSPSGGTP